MPDISMCSGQGCPKRAACYRFRAKPSHWQSFFASAPYDFKADDCPLYWPISSYKSSQLEDIDKLEELEPYQIARDIK